MGKKWISNWAHCSIQRINMGTMNKSRGRCFFSRLIAFEVSWTMVMRMNVVLDVHGVGIEGRWLKCDD
jgi:hypothetical protein